MHAFQQYVASTTWANLSEQGGGGRCVTPNKNADPTKAAGCSDIDKLTIKTLQDLEGKEVGFVSPDGFTGYWLPLDALLRSNVNVKVVFTGNQEASSTQLRISKIAAAGVNSSVMARYARREGFEYRALWTSEVYGDLAIMANPHTSPQKVNAVKKALVEMAKDPEGRAILQAGAELLKSNGELGFVSADDHEYDNYRKFYRTTKVPFIK